MDKYYVQIIARNYLKNIVDVPDSIKVHERFLYGLTKEQFEEGFSALSNFTKELYNDIIENPGDFGMLLKEIVEEDAKSPEYTNSNNSFLRVPYLLLILGVYSALESDMTMTIDSDTLMAKAKLLKISQVPFLLNKLTDYGFEISDFGKTPQPGTVLSLSYPDNRFLAAALKAMAEAYLELGKGDLKNKMDTYFFMLHPGILENEKVKEPKLAIDDFIHTLNMEQRKQALALHDSVADITKQKIRVGGFMRNDWSYTYTDNFSKKVLMTLQINQASFSIKLNLQHIGQFITLTNDMPDYIKNSLTNNGWDCGGCNPRCSGGFAFELNNTAYNKCHCGSFVFSDLVEENINSCKKLLAEEIEYRKKT